MCVYAFNTALQYYAAISFFCWMYIARTSMYTHAPFPWRTDTWSSGAGTLCAEQAMACREMSRSSFRQIRRDDFLSHAGKRDRRLTDDYVPPRTPTGSTNKMPRRRSVLRPRTKLPRKYLRTKFIDTLRLQVRGGTGGAGLPRYGGIGGAGGNVYVVTKDRLNLQDVIKKLKTKRIKASTGGDSSAKGIIGTPGEDKIISVPCGITIYNQNGVILGELNKEDMKLLVAKGGNGGSEETGYCGLKGESQTIKLDMKLIADVGLVGFPNAGKSTFLAAVSRAKPKIADYPFTTIRPRLGIMKYEDERQITVADLPGLIEGAHMNIGMGHKFLKHIERTKLLLFIVDIQGFQLSAKYTRRSCLETLVLLNKEIELYKPDLLKMPTMVIINKMDTDNANNILKEIKPALHDLSDFVATCPEEIRPEQIIQIDNILPVSLISKDKKQIEEIKERIRNTLDKYEERQHKIQYSDSLGPQLIDRIKQQTKQHTPTVI